MRFQVLITVLAFAYQAEALAQNQLMNGAEIHSKLRSTGALPVRQSIPDLSRLRVAIIDDAFDGVERYGNSSLGTKVQTLSMGQSQAQGASKHGFAMAQIFMAASGAQALPQSERPELVLISANGLSEFRSAIDFCLGKGQYGDGRRVDVVLHARNFDWSSNFEGGGFFNAEVERATRAGIVWINSVGNNADTVFFSNQTRIVGGRIVALPGPQNTLLFENRFDDQQFRILLSWDDFRSDSNYATTKDLDFSLLRYDERAKKMVNIEGAYGNKKQIGRHLRPGETGVSGNAFEELRIGLAERGLYALRIYDRSGNFALDDKFQVQITSPNPSALNFIHKNKVNELNAPADHSQVLAVGIRDAISASANNGSVLKPDVVLGLGRNDMKFVYSDSAQNGLDTSSATAIYAGIVVNLMAADQNFSLAKLQGYLRSLANNQGFWRWPLR
jgi:hypothetical protein